MPLSTSSAKGTSRAANNQETPDRTSARAGSALSVSFGRRLLLILVAGLCLAQSSSDMLTPAIRRVGDRLACLCGACKNTVATCQMLGCHYSSPARERIAKMQAEGVADDAIVDDFVKREGKRALAVPPAEGFHLLGWVMPFVAIALGLYGIYLFVQRHRRLAPAATPVDAAVMNRYKDAIDEDIAKLDQ